jgi:hypothetical protein
MEISTEPLPGNGKCDARVFFVIPFYFLFSFFCNLAIFAICTSTLSKLCKDIYSDM